MMNDYYQNSADAYDFTGGGGDFASEDVHDPAVSPEAAFRGGRPSQDVDFDDPKIASLPKILLMGPRRGGKTSIQVNIMFIVICLV